MGNCSISQRVGGVILIYLRVGKCLKSCCPSVLWKPLRLVLGSCLDWAWEFSSTSCLEFNQASIQPSAMQLAHFPSVFMERTCLEHHFLALIQEASTLWSPDSGGMDVGSSNACWRLPVPGNGPLVPLAAKFLATEWPWKQLNFLERLLGEVCLRNKVLCR